MVRTAALLRLGAVLCLVARGDSVLKTIGGGWPSRDAVPLNQFPFVMTHDSGTGYLGGDPTDWWTKTQTVGLGGQAQCGARAFDLRPHVNADGTVVLHHGPVVVQKALKDAVQELVEFANRNPNELVLLYVSHCDGDGCMARTRQALGSIGVPTCTDGHQLYGATYGSTKAMGRLSGGGAVLAIFGFVAENYNDALKCYVGAAYCYESDPGAALEPMWTYIRGLSAMAPAASGELQMIQAHWQYDAASIAAGVLHVSSVLDDESRSSLNSKVADAVTCSPCPPSGGVFKYNNLIQVNNVCDGGNKLYNALRTRVP